MIALPEVLIVALTGPDPFVNTAVQKSLAFLERKYYNFFLNIYNGVNNWNL